MTCTTNQTFLEEINTSSELLKIYKCFLVSKQWSRQCSSKTLLGTKISNEDEKAYLKKSILAANLATKTFFVAVYKKLFFRFFDSDEGHQNRIEHIAYPFAVTFCKHWHFRNVSFSTVFNWEKCIQMKIKAVLQKETCKSILSCSNCKRFSVRTRDLFCQLISRAVELFKSSRGVILALPATGGGRIQYYWIHEHTTIEFNFLYF